MPNRCFECIFLTTVPNFFCLAGKMDLCAEHGINISRPDWCPLIELPPHGRLIDADKLWDKMYKYSDNEGAKMPFGDNDFMIHRDSACELIEDAPTVIEAEGSEE